jgi:hypothetical protein
VLLLDADAGGKGDNFWQKVEAFITFVSSSTIICCEYNLLLPGPSRIICEYNLLLPGPLKDY